MNNSQLKKLSKIGISSLSTGFLSGLIRELDGENVVGMMLTGSYACGDFTEASDVDILRFLSEGSGGTGGGYDLQIFREKLVSKTDKTIGSTKAQFYSPGRTFYAVPGIRQAVILLDKDGSIEVLKREAFDFSWSLINEETDRYVSQLMSGSAEGAHKILGGLARDDWSAIFAGSFEIEMMLPVVIAVHKRMLFESENAFFKGVLDEVGSESIWADAFRRCIGIGNQVDFQKNVTERGIGSLQLYLETYRLAQSVIQHVHRPVIDETVYLIESHFSFGK